MEQDPPEGRSKKSSDGELIPISVTVSRGATSGSMPDLIGEDVRSAKLILERSKDLQKLNLNIEIIDDYEFDPEVPAGCIMRTEPAEGTLLHENDVVTLYLSKGPEIIYRTMIPCVGQNMEWVQLQMESMNLIPVFRPVESPEPVGTVLTQSVETNTEIAEGSTVEFTYSDGQKLLENTIIFDLAMVDYNVVVTIYLDDTVVMESELPGDFGIIQMPVYATAGVHVYRIYVDYVLIEQGEILFQ